MKTRLFIFLVVSFLMCSLSTGVLLAWRSSSHHVLKAAENKNILASEIVINQRQNITFILGEDEKADNPYFAHAASYYQQESRQGIDTLIRNIRTLLDVNQYLSNYPPKNGLPWGEIRLVVHSNEWMGLSAPLMEGTKRTTFEGMDKAIEQNLFKALSVKVADMNTQLQLWGCGLGNNQPLIDIIGKAFGEAKVYSPKHFVQYRKDEWGHVKRILNRCYYTTFPTAYRPSSTILAQRLKKAYPQSNVNWSDALQTPTASREDKAYNYSFKIPLVWLVSYEDKASRPRVNTQEEKDNWIADQLELQVAFKHYQLDKTDFTWTIYRKMHTFSDGITEPSIKAIGLCTILCILEPIGDPESGQGVAFLPLQPSLDNKTFYAHN